MNDPIRFWVCVWDNRSPTLYVDKVAVMNEILAADIDPDEIEDYGDIVLVDDWVRVYLVPLLS